MNRWKEQLEGHGIHETLKWLSDSVSNEFDDIDENEASEKRRLLKLIQKYKEVLDAIDPEVTPFNQIDGLNRGLTNSDFAKQINDYVKTGSVANLVEASNLLSNHITPLSVLLSIAEKAPLQQPIADLEKLIDSLVNTLVRKKDELSSSLDELEISVAEKAQAQDVLSTQIEDSKSEISAVVNEWQKQFSGAQENRSQEFSKWRDNFSAEKSSEVEVAIQDYRTKLTESTAAFQGEVSEIIIDGKEKHTAILELYEITAGDSVGAGYLSSANSEKNQADTWRTISVGFIITTAVWLLFSFFYNAPKTSHSLNIEYITKSEPQISKEEKQKKQGAAADDAGNGKKKSSFPKQPISSIVNEPPFPWYTLFVTFSLSGVLLWGSAYAAQQSTKHRINEKKARWFALEVRAFDPFINSLDDKDKNDLKRQFSEKIFGHSLNTDDDNVKVIDEHVFKTVADTLGAILSKIPK
jgi:hypothetical protein